MYNRYIPQQDGSFQRNRISDNRHNVPTSKPETPQLKPSNQPSPPTDQVHPPASAQNSSVSGFLKQLLPKNCDTGDLLIILLFLLIAGDCENEKSTALLTLAFYFFL